MVEFVLLDRARARYEALDPDERAEADRAIRLLESNPWIDGVTKAEILVAPLVLSAFNDGRWRMIYRVVDGRFIEVFAITRVSGAMTDERGIKGNQGGRFRRHALCSTG